MEYEIEFKPKAIKDLDSLQRDDARRIVERIKRMRNNLEGDVKHLTNFTPEYRLRVGDFRVLFELAGNRVTVGRNGVVSANINAREIVVLGKVRGNLTASDRVDIRSDGSLTGDVVAARISIEDGAFFKGGIDIRKGGQKPNGEEVKASSSAVSTEVAAARA